MIQKENKILDNIIRILNELGTEEAYKEAQKEFKIGNISSSQAYNYLYCLAALCKDESQALKYLEEAIIEKGFWYRPEVFEDSDLDIIKENEKFKRCKEISIKKYNNIKDKSKTLFTWKEKKKENIIVVVHGNQQNIEIAKEEWSFLDESRYQIEYIQSSVVDSINLYRWESNMKGYIELEKCLNKMPWYNYDNRILCGFSSGCNVILNTISKTEINCSQIILQSPYLPYIEKRMEEIVSKLKEKNIKTHIICGFEDSDCLLEVNKLIEYSLDNDYKINYDFFKQAGHEITNEMKRTWVNIL